MFYIRQDKEVRNENILDFIITNGNFIKDIKFYDLIGKSNHVVYHIQMYA